ncbi:Bestrophin domain-containing protein [Rhizoctonia solani AG-1 IA]|uniref:Bestrophin domain-containing protein n=1 Tax=Thanatephorus cucumeris (strain AG1-IA) TaxID=983506 RepID=L8X6A3_THACA|nr:Bestrophin domain-containing protein [Rhizoctonia solani AG-1 IA]
MTALRSISKILRGETDLERHRRRIYYTWLVDVIRIDGSVTLRILGPVLTVTLFATFVATMVQVYGHNWKLTNNVVPLLSVVVGLILVFRTSYDRYYEGRKDFGTLMSNVRNLARLLWVNSNLPHASDDTKAKQPSAFMKIRGKTYQPSSSIKNPVITSASLRAEKERALKLMVAFVVAVKHHLRSEQGVEHPDYLGLLPPDFSKFDNRGFNKSGKHGTRDYSRLSNSSAIDIPGKNGNASGHSHGLSTSVGDMDATLVPGSVPRSPHKITFLGNKGAAPDSERDPLLRGESTTVEFRPYDTRKALPMPLVRSGILDTIGPAGKLLVDF